MATPDNSRDNSRTSPSAPPSAPPAGPPTAAAPDAAQAQAASESAAAAEIAATPAGGGEGRDAPLAPTSANGRRAGRPAVAAGPAAQSQRAARAGERRLCARRPQFMISTRNAAGLQPLSADLVEQQMRGTPDIEFVGRIEPPQVLDLQSVGSTTGSIVLARMDFDKAQLLRNQAGSRATVERDMPLTYSLDPGPADLGFRNPGVLVPHAAGFQTTIVVTGDGVPLAGAEVYIFGSVWPTQGITDAAGVCSISILGESPDTIRAVYVKPKLDYWSLWMPRPDLVPGGTTTVEVKPLSAFLNQFPDRQLVGWGCAAMGLDRVPLSMNGAGVKIAIIDSGVARDTHRNLHRTGPGLSVVGPDTAAWTDDTIGHGSHCAGIIAGGPVGPNGVGVRGFAPGAEIHICRIFPGGRFSDLVGALDYCMENGIDVVNMSLGGGEPSQIIEERLVRAKQMGIACIVAAGNSGGAVQFPASTPHALAVAAVGQWGSFPADSYHSQQALGGATSGTGYFAASFSCFGPEIDVCAPGVAIVSTVPPDGFAAWDGTSMAAPHVTGLAALVLAHHPDFKGAFQTRDARRVERLFQIIKDSATPLPVGGAERQGAGLPSAPRALGLATETAATASAGAAPIVTDTSIEALRKLLSMIGGGDLPAGLNLGAFPSGAPSGSPAASRPFAGVEPASTPPLRTLGAEPWSNAPTARGPADVSLAAASFWQSASWKRVPLTPAAPTDMMALRDVFQRGQFPF